jgi:hypothetical protein
MKSNVVKINVNVFQITARKSPKPSKPTVQKTHSALGFFWGICKEITYF